MRPKKYRRSRNDAEHRLVCALDDLAEFEQFKEEILPALRKDIESGLESREIIKKYRAIAAAKLVTAVFIPTAQSALSAAKDILDRGDGKPTETKKVEHKFAEVADEDLDALLKSKLASEGD